MPSWGHCCGPAAGTPRRDGARVLAAELTWNGEAFAPGLGVWIDGDGRIARVASLDGPLAAPDPERGPAVECLSGVALLPGFVNAHSHAFQRGLRGQGERFPRRRRQFWTWREAMYALVETLDAGAAVRPLARGLPRDAAAGITAVGEFHYLHHSAAGGDSRATRRCSPRARPASGSCCCEAYYKTGGIGGPLRAAQRRFDDASSASTGTRWTASRAALDRARRAWESGAQHPRRAAARAARAARRVAAQGLPFHLHLEEQRQEIDECRRGLRQAPARAAAGAGRRLGRASRPCTAPTAAPTSSGDSSSWAAASASAPSPRPTSATASPPCRGAGEPRPDLPRHRLERPHLDARGDALARVRAAPEDREPRRARDPEGGLARRLLDAATRVGADALGVVAGRIAPGAWADFVAVDLASPLLAPGLGEQGLAGLLLGCGDEVIVNSCVGGEWLRPWPAAATRAEPSWSGAP